MVLPRGAFVTQRQGNEIAIVFLTTIWRYRQGEGNQIVPGEGDGDRKKDDMGVACL